MVALKAASGATPSGTRTRKIPAQLIDVLSSYPGIRYSVCDLSMSTVRLVNSMATSSSPSLAFEERTQLVVEARSQPSGLRYDPMRGTAVAAAYPSEPSVMLPAD